MSLKVITKLLAPALLCTLSCPKTYAADACYPDDYPGDPIKASDPNILIEADRGKISVSEKSVLTGSVILKHEDKKFRADKTTLGRDPLSGEVTGFSASGHVTLDVPNLRLQSAYINSDLVNNKVSIENTAFFLSPRRARGGATLAALDGDELILEDAHYTTCPRGNETWQIKASHMEINKASGRGEAEHVLIYLKDVPVLYTPYFNFPVNNERKSGLLYPSFGHSERSGLEFGIPFYWNIAPNYDATFTPRVLTERGLDLKTQFRYLTSQSAGDLRVAILPNDRAYRDFRRKTRLNHPGIATNDPRVANLDEGNTRLALSWQHSSQLTSRLRARADYNFAGDDNYFMDLGNNLATASNSQLLQEMDITYSHPDFNANLLFQNYQVLHPFNGPIIEEPYRLLPKFSFVYAKDLSDNLFDWNLSGEAVHFTHPRNLFGQTNKTTGERFNIRPQIALPLENSAGFFIPSILLDYTAYSLTETPERIAANQSNHLGRFLPVFNIDTGLFFERPYDSHYLQTIEPRLYYLYVPFKSQNAFPNFDTALADSSYAQLFRRDRFVGKDRVGDTNQLGVSFASRTIETQTGTTRLHTGVGEIFYFTDRHVTLCNTNTDPTCWIEEQPLSQDSYSPLVAFVDIHWHDDWSFFTDIEWQIRQHQSTRQSTNFQYHPDQYHVLNLGYEFLRTDPGQVSLDTNISQALQQAVVSTAWSLSPNWQMIGGFNYDMSHHHTVNVLAGFEYDTCCAGVRFVARRYLEPNRGEDVSSENKNHNTGFFIQFVLKGLAAMGNNHVDNTLAQWVPGYHSVVGE